MRHVRIGASFGLIAALGAQLVPVNALPPPPSLRVLTIGDAEAGTGRMMEALSYYGPVSGGSFIFRPLAEEAGAEDCPAPGGGPGRDECLMALSARLRTASPGGPVVIVDVLRSDDGSVGWRCIGSAPPPNSQQTAAARLTPERWGQGADPVLLAERRGAQACLIAAASASGW